MPNPFNPLYDEIGSTDIYLLDQIMKGRYRPKDTVLDAGCGVGRNLHWFIRHEMAIYGVDMNEGALAQLMSDYPLVDAGRFLHSSVEELPFDDHSFDHVISSAVLHFARNTPHFRLMMAEMVRVLRPGGSLFVRMTSDIGIENAVQLIEDGVYNIPDGSRRFLLTRALLAETMNENRLVFLEPLKTVNVDGARCMSTLVLGRSASAIQN